MSRSLALIGSIIWIASPSSIPIAWANSPARGTSGCVDDSWAATNTTGAPSAGSGHSAVWTGTEMLVWGGLVPFAVPTNTGGRYDPGTDTWTMISTEGAPTARGWWSTNVRAIWTATEMLVWGGRGGAPFFDYLNTGGSYDLATDTWMTMSTLGAPSTRDGHTAIWTGTEMIVWGASTGSAGTAAVERTIRRRTRG